jgi:hypothetical protein
MRPQKGTYPPYFENYIPLVNHENVNVAFEQNWNELKELFSQIPKDKEDFAYAPGKWTIKQVVNHMIDTERIFTYRALRFARKDFQAALSFEENDYAEHDDVQKRTLADLVEEFEAVRRSSTLLFKSFSDTTLLNSGKTAAGVDCTVLAYGFTTCGHAKHHINVLKERYLKK